MSADFPILTSQAKITTWKFNETVLDERAEEVEVEPSSVILQMPAHTSELVVISSEG